VGREYGGCRRLRRLPKTAELPAVLEVDQYLDEPVDLRPRHVPLVLEAHQAERLGCIAGVLEPDLRSAEQGDPASPARVEELRPRDGLGRAFENTRVVPDGVHVEVG